MKRSLLALAAIGPLLALPVQAGESAKAHSADHWFYVVKTKSADPAQDAAFNAWYDDIDIPDVLAVDGFNRARRAKLTVVEGEKRLKPAAKEGDYIALYDIESANIDKSIIDLYVAARKMNALGRSTDLLKVTEASYYRRLESIAPDRTAPGNNQFVLVQKMLCCTDEAGRAAFVEWFRQDYGLALSKIPGLERVELYSLYRVMEPTAMTREELPHFLVMYEVASKSAARAIYEAIDAFSDAGNLPASFKESDDSALYRQLNETYSK